MSEAQRVVARAVVAFAVAGCVQVAAAADGRVDIPIRQTVLPNGDIRYGVAVSVGGGQPIEAELDTGSFGLRVLKAAVTPAQYQATDIRRRFPFSGGARFTGVLAKASVAVGDLQSAGAIFIQVIESVDCVESKPHCPASRVSAKDYRIAGDGYPGLGFNAILGISMRKAAVSPSADNPLTAMGDGRWMVILPRPGGGDGHLIINPTPEEQAGFSTLQLTRQGGGWADGALPGCLLNEETKAKDCGKTLLDTGAPGFYVDSERASEAKKMPSGQPVRLDLGDEKQPISIAFKAGMDFSSRVVLRPPSDDARISAGNLPFFQYVVLYDTRAGTMGFKQRSDGE